MDLMDLNERQFGWFFIPMIGGMMLGAYTSGRMAGRISGARLANIGFACCGVGAVANVAYNLLVPVPSRSEEHTSELQSLMRISYAVFCLKKKTKTTLQKH